MLRRGGQNLPKSPRGFGDAELTEEDTLNLTRAENARKKLVTAVDTLRGKVRSANAEQISRELYFCLKELGAEGQQAAQVEDIRTARGIPAAEEAAREWNVVMQLLLDEMARLLGSQGITVPEYEDLSVCCCAPLIWGTSRRPWTRWCWQAPVKCVWMRRTMCSCWGLLENRVVREQVCFCRTGARCWWARWTARTSGSRTTAPAGCGGGLQDRQAKIHLKDGLPAAGLPDAAV